MLFVLLAFSSCQKGPVMYTIAEKPSEVVTNAEKFVKQTEKRSSHYTAEDWQVAVDQFVAMSKNYMDKKTEMSEAEVNRFTSARLNFMKSVQKNGTEELALQIKEVYSRIEPQN
jgi:hypothetical protein